MTVTGITLTNSDSGELTISNSLSGTGTLTQDTNSPLLGLGGTVTVGTLNARASGNTVDYVDTSGDQTMAPATYYDLLIDKGSAGRTLSWAAVPAPWPMISLLIAARWMSRAVTTRSPWAIIGPITTRSFRRPGLSPYDGSGNQTINDSNEWYGLAIIWSSARTVSFSVYRHPDHKTPTVRSRLPERRVSCLRSRRPRSPCLGTWPLPPPA